MSYCFKVWLLVLLTMFVMMSLMNIFSKISREIKTSTVGENAKTTNQRKQSLFENASFCAIYIVNTVTNQGMFSSKNLIILYYYISV